MTAPQTTLEKRPAWFTYDGEADASRMAWGQWLPIETAPKDGTHILACQMTDGYYFPTDTWWCNGEWVDLYSPSQIPTHWLPLPPPPQEPQGEEPYLTKTVRERSALRTELNGTKQSLDAIRESNEILRAENESAKSAICDLRAEAETCIFLRAENERLRAALEKIADMPRAPKTYIARAIARAALANSGGKE